ncbi:MAG: MFS transporter [Verrucomicrobiota bacterium]|nr:MFS transporter [Verrucomicrobiota bacterium]
MIRFLYLGSRLLSSPLEAMFTLLIFILSKDLGASPLQIAIIACSKPIVSLIAFYASSFLQGRPECIRIFLLGAICTGSIPCLFFPFIDNIWFFVASYPLFIASQRAVFPAWNEALKEKVGLSQMPTLIAKGVSIHYFLLICIPVFCSFFLDQNPQIWKVLFCGLGALQLLSLFLILFLKLQSTKVQSLPFSFRSITIGPWQSGLRLLRQRPDFARYLLLFFLGGAGIIAIQPIIPIFFKETLRLSYQELTLAISLCKGVAFIATSEIWARLSQRMSLYRLNGYVNLFSCLFIALLVLSSGNTAWLYAAFLMYGIMQGGAEISWNLSGPMYSEKKESTAFSNLNLALVGIRGCICPVIASLTFLYSSSSAVFIGAGCLCFLSLLYALWLDRQPQAEISHVH